MVEQPKKGPIEVTKRVGDTGESTPSARDESGILKLPEGIAEKGPPAPEGLTGPLPNVRLSKEVLQSMRRMDMPAMLSFKLPGLNRVIHDKRGEAKDAHGREAHHREVVQREGREEAAREGRAERVIKEGRPAEVREKKYENYLGERQQASAAREQQKVAERPLSKFEKEMIIRFEEGKELGQAAKEGEAKFLGKTALQWRAFFEKFLGRTAKKSLPLSDVQELMYRGMVKKGDAKAVVISDLVQTSGKMEKFIRFGVIYQKVGEFLSRLLPGDLIAKKVISDGIASERLKYLALTSPKIEHEFATGMKPKMGMFSTEAMEQYVARELGIGREERGAPTTPHDAIARGRKRRGLGGFFRWLVGGEESPIEEGRFVPWWQWGRLERPGGYTLKRAFYTALFVIFILTILFLVHQYLLGK